ncbi:2OG-Fe(II) oxygenase [Trichothermofontia sp.]
MQATAARPRIRFRIGDTGPVFALRSQADETMKTADLIGQPLLFFLYDRHDQPQNLAILKKLREHYPEFLTHQIMIVAINSHTIAENAELAQQHDIPFRLLSLEDGKMMHYFGIGPDGIDRKAVLFRPNYRVLKTYDTVNPDQFATQILADVAAHVRLEPARYIPMQAPVLVIPDVFDRDFCRYLMRVWETEGNVDSGSMVQREGKTIGVLNYDRKIRRDHFMSNPELIAQVKSLISARVCPEIEKAFQYSVTRFEDFRIICYEAERGGYFRPHRDNTTDATAHRRFAMSINLNTEEYDGGYLRFPEYAPHLYRPETGCAVIFSCSILHEVTDIERGNRFALTSFLYGEAEARIREEYNRRTGGDYRA